MTTENEALERAIAEAGGVSALADKMGGGVTPQRICNWRSRGVPPESCPQIEAVTSVMCEELRKDFTWDRDKKGRVISYRVPLAAQKKAA